MGKFLKSVIVLTFFIGLLSVNAATNLYAGTSCQIQDAVIKSEVNTAITLLGSIYKKVEKGEMKIEAAKKLAADLLRDLRYDDKMDSYFFVDTTEGVNVVSYGRKDIEGKKWFEAKINGIYYVKEIITMALKGGGYTNYWFPKKCGRKPVAKRSYVMFFKPFHWVVGTGYYIEDVK